MIPPKSEAEYYAQRAKEARDQDARDHLRNASAVVASGVLGCASAWSILVLDWWTVVWFGAVWGIHEGTEAWIRQRWPKGE